MPTVKETKAGPFSDVPITPAGTPTGRWATGPVRSISLAVTPAEPNFSWAMLAYSASCLTIPFTTLSKRQKRPSHELDTAVRDDEVDCDEFDHAGWDNNDASI